MAKQQVEKKICSIGGQAVMEGVMMKAPAGFAMAVRQSDGQIITEFTPYVSKIKKGTVTNWPIVRGVIAFVESLTLGMKNITRSAELYGEDIEEEPSKFEKWLARVTGKDIEKIVVGVAVVLAILLSVGLFFLLPTFVSGLILQGSAAASIWKSLTEGMVRLLIFLGYIIAIGNMKDVKRLFMYHGAEHKTIACYESGEELTPENAMNHSRFHPRCGTNYMFLVMGISILFFAVVGWNANLWLRLLTRVLFLPVVAGLSYEVLKFGARSDNLLARIVRAPGMALQKITTKEPEKAMLEVAITSFMLAMSHEEEPSKDGEAAVPDAEKNDTPEGTTAAGEIKE